MVLYAILPVEGPTCGIGFNYARVLGLTGGIGILSHFINEREKLHSLMIGENINIRDEQTLSTLDTIKTSLGSHFTDTQQADLSSYMHVAQKIKSQAFVLSYNDAFFLVCIVLAVSAACIWVFPKNKAIH